MAECSREGCSQWGTGGREGGLVREREGEAERREQGGNEEWREEGREGERDLFSQG